MRYNSKIFRILTAYFVLLASQTKLYAQPANGETIRVEGNRAQHFTQSGSKSRLDREFLETYKTTDLNRILRSIPGVQVQEEDGFGLRINIGMRGAHPHRSRKVLMMEDGILIGPAPYSAPAAYYTPMMTRLDGLTVTKGPSAITYGPQTIGGAINFHTLNPDYDYRSVLSGYADISAGSYGMQKTLVTMQGGSEKLSYLLHGLQLNTDGFKTLPQGGPTGFDKKDLLAKLIYNVSETDDIVLKLGINNELSYETYLGLSDQDFNESPYQRYAASSRDYMDARQRQINLSYEMNRSSIFSGRLTAYYHKFDRLWSKFSGLSAPGFSVQDVLERPYGRNQHSYAVIKGEEDSTSASDQVMIGNNDRSYESFGLNWSAKHLVVFGEESKYEIKWGLRLHEDYINRNHSEDKLEMMDGNLQASDSKRRLTTQNKDTAEALAAYVLNTYQYKSLTLNAGVRLENVQLNRVDRVEADNDISRHSVELIPGFGLFYEFWRGYGILFGVNRGIGLAGIDDASEGNPEESINYEFGFRLEDQSLALDAISFYADYRNIKGTCSFSSGCDDDSIDRTFDGGKAKVYGLEFSGRYDGQWLGLYWPMSWQYTYTKAYFINEFQSILPEWGLGDIKSGDPLPYIPENQWAVNLGVRSSWNQLFLSYRFNSSQYDQSVEEGRKIIPQTRNLDARVSFWLGTQDQYEVYLTADNLLANKNLVSYRPYGARPAKPRSFAGGIKMSF